MLSSDEGGPDVFFDSLDCLPSELPFLAKAELGSNKFEYDIWMNEPQSVNERREGFLRRMDLIEISSSSKDCSTQLEMKMTKGLEPFAVCTRQVSGTFIEPSDSATVAKILSDESRIRGEEKGDVASRPKAYEPSSCTLEDRQRDAQAHEECRNFDMNETKMKKWFKQLLNRNNKSETGMDKSVLARRNVTKQIQVKRHKKRWMEFTGVYTGQEIRAHKGLIWTMKFSPDGQYLASGGEDGVVRLWQVTSLDTSSNFSTDVLKRANNVKDNLFSSLRKASNDSSILLPKKVFYIEETPIQEFYGHSSGVLDLAWSHSNRLLSSSKDKTVRLWQGGCEQCLNVFRHKDYVTCVQFNPVDENHFISGSLDGKVRIWGVSEKRVVDWADIRDGITAICYHPNGNGFIVGSFAGSCRFYAASGEQIQLEAQIYVQGKKTLGNRITGIQFSLDKCQRAMVTSEDSKIRVLDGTNVHCKYKGLPKSGSQMSASCTSTGKHMVSVGKDSHVCIWNLVGLNYSSRKQNKSVRSCEYFFCEGATVALAWSSCLSKERIHHQGHWIRDPERFSLSNWFSMDGGRCRGSLTWPEEKLPIYEQKQHLHSDIHDWTSFCETWGLVIVTADSNGTIKTFHNFGFPDPLSVAPHLSLSQHVTKASLVM